jgi:hypothetical protein
LVLIDDAVGRKIGKPMLNSVCAELFRNLTC